MTAHGDRSVFVNRTLNMRSIKAIGYDLDYTLVHYNTDEWERAAYGFARNALAERGWPVDGLSFDPSRVIQGLTIDLELGNLVKATRFGYVIRASHGTRFLEFGQLRGSYSGEMVDLASDRWVFLNTLFSLSEALLFSQLVDLADSGAIPEPVGYEDLYATVRGVLDTAHRGGRLKASILADPERFIEPDPAVGRTLLDQAGAGKRLLLITNSDLGYASEILDYALDPYLEGRKWRDIFDCTVVSADKPRFFSDDRPLYEVVDGAAGLLRAHHGDLETNTVYSGGSASQVESSLGVSGDEILYVGDHLFGDVHVSKSMFRWRTALVLRELEPELAALRTFAESSRDLVRLMREKEALERDVARERLGLQHGEGDRSRLDELTHAVAALDDRIAPLAIASGELSNEHWGLLMRAGVDKSLFARQVERHADIYMSRVSNLASVTPHGIMRAAWVPLPHD